MKQSIIDRYARTEDGRIIIDITAGRVEDVYSDFDKSAHYLKKDLDSDLVDYIVNSVREIGNEDFVIRFGFGAEVAEALMTRVRMSVHSFFLYMKELELKEMRGVMRTSLTLFITGLAVLTLSVIVHRGMGPEAGVVKDVFAEGLTVAAWVSLWESIGRFLFSALPRRKRIRRCHRIAAAEILFQEPKPVVGAR